MYACYIALLTLRVIQVCHSISCQRYTFDRRLYNTLINALSDEISDFSDRF